jgi:hypothetical protein
MRFRGSYEFLSNFYPSKITMRMPDGKQHTFLNAEAAFQAQKSSDPDVIAEFENMRGAQAKRRGRTVKIEDLKKWNAERVDIMTEIVRQKFEQNPELLQKLRSIEGPIVEDNEWNDTFWGVCNGKGENHLGKILMVVRDNAEQ